MSASIKTDTHQNTVDEYAKFLEDTSWYTHTAAQDQKEFAYLTLGLVGEAGEFADQFKKIIREIGFDEDEEYRQLMNIGGNRLKAIDELGDVLWYLVRLCDLLEINLTTLMAFNTAKLYSRLKDKGLLSVDAPWPFSDPLLSRENVTKARASTARGF